MNITIRNRSSLDDIICVQIMSSASKQSKEINWLKIAQLPEVDDVSHQLFGNLRLIAILDGQPVGFTDYVISSGAAISFKGYWHCFDQFSTAAKD